MRSVMPGSLQVRRIFSVESGTAPAHRQTMHRYVPTGMNNPSVCRSAAPVPLHFIGAGTCYQIFRHTLVISAPAPIDNRPYQPALPITAREQFSFFIEHFSPEILASTTIRIHITIQNHPPFPRDVIPFQNQFMPSQRR